MSASVRFADKDILRKLNDEAIGRDYNRAIQPAFIDKQPDDEIFAVAPIMIHEHAQGRPVDPHLRCSIHSATGRTDLGFVMLDVPFELFELLPEREETDNG